MHYVYLTNGWFSGGYLTILGPVTSLRKGFLRLVEDRSSVSSGEAAEALGVTRQTAHRHLTDLVREGELERRGQGRATRYVLSLEALVPTAVRVLEDAATETSFLEGVVDLRRQRFRADDRLAGIAWAFDYILLDDEWERHPQHGPFGPMIETPTGQYPPPLREVPDEVLSLWGALSRLVTHPYLRARLNDLLWERRWSPSPYAHAIAAIEAYLELAPPIADGLDYANALGRAGRLARQLSDDDRRRRVVEAALDRARMELGGPGPKPGIVLELLGVARHDRDENVRRRVADLLQRAALVFDDPWIRDQIIEWQRAVPSDEREPEDDLQRQSVDNWRQQALSASGVKRRFYLTKALDHARTYGLRDTAEEIRAEIQELEIGEDEMQRVSGAVDLPTDYIEETIDGISSADSWGDCLRRLMTLGPLSGSLEKNIQTVRRQREQFPLQHLAINHVLGPWNETIFEARNERESSELNLSRHESLTIDVASYIAAEALERIRSTHGHPARAELQAFFCTPIIDIDTAERMAAGVEHFARNRFDECVLVLLPRIETTIRELLRKIGAPVWKEPQPSRRSFGHQRPLRQLLGQLKGNMDEDWRRYLFTLLVNPLGPNLRNIYMHGLRPQGTREHAAALIHVAVFLTFARPETAGPTTSHAATQP